MSVAFNVKRRTERATQPIDEICNLTALRSLQKKWALDAEIIFVAAIPA